MATGEGESSTEPELQGPEGLLFTGGAIRALTPDRLAAIGEFASRMYRVEMRPVRSVEQELGEMALRIEKNMSPEPFPMQQKDFFRFAREHGLSKYSARSAFLWVKAISTGRREARAVPQDLPPVTLIGDIGLNAHTAIELHSLYAHLLQAFGRYGQTSASEQQEGFLVRLLNETLQPSELLVSKRLTRRR